jgi:hypothetical protein
VKEVRVEVGQMVDPDFVMVVIEPDEDDNDHKDHGGHQDG